MKFETKKCAYCGTENPWKVRKCSGCGAGEFEYKCPLCGASTPVGECCPNCGALEGEAKHTCEACGRIFYGKKCPDCGRTLLTHNYGSAGSTAYSRVTGDDLPNSISAVDAARLAGREPNAQAEKTPLKASGLSIAAFAVSLLPLINMFIAIPLALIDLIRHRKDRKHGLSRAAILITVILTAFFYWLGSEDEATDEETPPAAVELDWGAETGIDEPLSVEFEPEENGLIAFPTVDPPGNMDYEAIAEDVLSQFTAMLDGLKEWTEQE